MKAALPSFLFLSLLLVGGCKSKPQADPEPAQLGDMDMLLHSTGYWEWQNSASMTSQLTPASVGFSRELIFKSDGLVHIYHNRQPAMQPVYKFSFGVLSQCGTQPQPPNVILLYYTAEPQIPNNELREYLIHLSPNDTTLSINGELACVNRGYYETYRWRRH